MTIGVIWKLVAGGLLIGLVVCMGLAAMEYRFAHPALTETELFNAIGWIPLVAGIGLIKWAKEENEDGS